MKKLLLAILAVALVLQLQPAESLEINEYNVTFDILPAMKVNETISMTFPQQLNETTLNYIIVGSVSDIYITNGEESIDFLLERTENEYKVKFAAPSGTERLAINFISNDLVFYGGEVYNFFTGLSPPEAKIVSVKAYLPKGFAIYRDVVYPGGYETMSDGERIYLSWEMEAPREIPLSFKFYNTRSDYSLIVFAATSVAAAAMLAYLITHYRKRIKQEFVRGFSEDERKVLSALSERKTCMQNKLEKECGFSRAKMTRVVKKLETKGLVEKERIGRTNRLFYKKQAK